MSSTEPTKAGAPAESVLSQSPQHADATTPAAVPEADPASPATPATPANTPTTVPAPDAVPSSSSSPTSAPRSIAEEMLSRLKPFLSADHVEVEARLCNFSTPQVDKTRATSPSILSGPYGRIQVGVSADDFARMRAYVESEKKLSPHHVQTEDVITRGGRFTYAVAEDGTETFVGCIEKKRLCNVEVFVPDCPYDIRLSISTEVPREQQDAPAEKPRGFVRQKSRWVATEGTYEYAFTRVGGPSEQKAVYEVEVEGVHANSAEGVTAAWLEELLCRLLHLARLEGNTGLPKNNAPEFHSGDKRRRQ